MKKEIGKKETNIMFHKTGKEKQYTTTRISLAESWVNSIGAFPEDRKVNVYLLENKIIITKEDLTMEYNEILYKKYKGWRNQMEELLEDGIIDSLGGSVDCGEGAVREDFTAWAHLYEEIEFEDMLELERRYNYEFDKETW